MNTQFFSSSQPDSLAVESAGVSSIPFNKTTIRFKDAAFLSPYNLEELFVQILEDELPRYLLNGVIIHFNPKDIRNYFTETRVANSIQQEIHIFLNLNNIIANVYLLLRSENRLGEFGLDNEDLYYSDGERITKMEQILITGERVDQFRDLIQETYSIPKYRKLLARSFDFYTIFHELMHAFLFRIYYSNIDRVAPAEAKPALLAAWERFREKVNLELASYKSESIADIVNANRAVFKKLIHAEVDERIMPEVFCSLYITGVQEVWIRLLEARKNIIDEKVYYSLPENKYSRAFRYQYRDGTEIVNDVLTMYVDDSILIDAQILVDLSQNNNLTVEFIDRFIKERIFPLMDSRAIEAMLDDFMI